MSVFSDFQRMWVQRFPQSSLSDAWEQDVRASLMRHRQKITDLTKELEQEKMYVDYLESLLNDVEKYRDAGGDPTSLFEEATRSGPYSGSNNNNEPHNLQTSNKPNELTDDENAASTPSSATTTKTSTANSDGIDDNITNKSNNRNSLHLTTTGILKTSAKTNGSTIGTLNGSGGIIDNNEEERDKENKDGALNQCINELSSNLRRCVSELAESNLQRNNNHQGTTSRSRCSSQSDDLSKSPLSTLESTAPSHFVTVIEVKESTSNELINEINDSAVSSTTTSSLTTTSTSTTSIKTTPTTTAAAATATSSFNLNKKDQYYCENETFLGNSSGSIDKDYGSGGKSSDSDTGDSKKYGRPIVPPALSQDARKKVPPRPPPKFIRRAAPIEPPTVPTLTSSLSMNAKSDKKESPSNSLERNIKPSEILRQKSSDCFDPKTAVANRRTTPDISKFSKSSDLAEEFGKKLAKSESLDKTKRPSDAIKNSQSPTGSLGKAGQNSSPTGSLGKMGSGRSTDSPTGSLGKVSNRATDSLQSVGSKESLASQGISERIKSYESISSLSSDSTKAGGHNAENEPYYDTVPEDNGDGDYVYIQAGGNGSTSSRDDISTAGSTLPLPAHPRNLTTQTSVTGGEPESPGRSSNYVNIDYFLHSSNQNHETRSSSIDSDGELDQPALMRAISHDENPQTPISLRKQSITDNRSTIINSIISSIINSEQLYVEYLNKMMQYMKAIRATLTTSQPVITEDEFQTMFYKIDDLHEVHTEFLNDLKNKTSQLTSNGDIYVGEVFKKLAGHIHLYGAFLHNYGHAIDTVKKCGANNTQFKKIVSNIVVNSKNEQSLSLEDLLHKPVARVQKNALVLQDLLNETKETHPDYQPLKQAQKIIRNFLSEFNVIQTKTMFPSDDKALRRLVKNSFIVELADGHRKLRHLFLFNDVIACAKYKPSGRDRFEYELKWFIPLKDIFVLEESSFDPKETSPINILQLKSQACTVRDQIMIDDSEKKRFNGSRTGDKHRKKLADLEAQLVLASPNLVFRIGNKSTNKTMIFYLSSDFERTQWVESIITLQQSCNLPGANPVNMYELQAWITACRTLIKTEMGSYLMRNSREESLFVGDLHLTIQGLQGLDQPADLFICVEIDSYGHYFRKAKTKLICRSASPLWNEPFVLELEGSQNVRILLYEDHPHRAILRAKTVIKLSREWLRENPVNKPLKLSDQIVLSTTLKFVPGEVTLRRVPTSKPGALFGAKMQQVLKREKRDIPFIITACIREVERRGMCEIGIYRVSGSASDLAKLKKSFETNPYEAEQLLKEVDIHSVSGILRSYLRELPEALFTDAYYPKFFETYNDSNHSNYNDPVRVEALLVIFNELPVANKATINFILDHLIRVNHKEIENKMSLHNLAMVFGPTLLRPGPQTNKQHKEMLESGTVDVMAQAGILYCFLQARLK